MRPIFYPETEQDFTSNGLGVLGDAISCLVTEERNGEYELEMQYPANGIWSEELEVGQIIKAKANDSDSDQLFVIYDILRNLSGAYEVHAQHISYRLSGVPVRTYSAASAADAVAGISTNAMTPPFEFDLTTDITSTTPYSIEVPRSARSIMGGEEGSLLDVYGGEWHFNNFKAELLASRGVDNGVSIRYGKNLTDISQEINGAVYNGLYPYWYREGEGLVAPHTAVIADGVTVPCCEIVDMTDDFEEMPTESDLVARARQLVDGMGSPVETLEVSFVTLHQLQEYQTIATLEMVRLCDIVHVVYPLLHVDVKMKVVKTIYNVLTEHYESITCGTLRTTLADLISDASHSGGSSSEPTIILDEDEYKIRTVTQLSSTSISANGGKDVGFTAPSTDWTDGGIKYKLVSNCPLQINTRGTGSTYVICSQQRPGGCYLRNTGSGSATVEVLTYYLYQRKRNQS